MKQIDLSNNKLIPNSRDKRNSKVVDGNRVQINQLLELNPLNNNKPNLLLKALLSMKILNNNSMQWAQRAYQKA